MLDIGFFMLVETEKKKSLLQLHIVTKLSWELGHAFRKETLLSIFIY